jgi:hypothetical protein
MSRHAADEPRPRRSTSPAPEPALPPLCPASRASGVSLVDVAVRPWRYALAIRSGHVGDLGRAIALATESWGGVGWPIISVNPNGTTCPVAVEVAVAVGVDAVVDLRGDDGAGRGAVPDLPWAVLDAPAEDLTGRCLPPDLSGAPVSLAATGRLTEVSATGMLDGVRSRILWQASGVRLEDELDPVALALAQVMGRTPVVAGQHRSAAAATGARGTIGLVWVTAEPEMGVADAIGFWNARALRGRGGVGGVAVLAEPDVLAEPTVRDALAEALRSSSCGEPACVVLSATVEGDRLTALAADLGAAAYGPGGEAVIAVGENLPELWGGEVRLLTTPVVAVRQRDRIDLRVPGSVPVHPGLVGLGEVVLTVGAEALTGPRRPGVARLHHPAGAWAVDGLRIPVTPSSRYDLTLRVPSPRDILAAALADRGVKVVSGDTGALVDRLVEKLSDPTVLRRPELQALLGALAVLGGVPGDPVPLTGLAAAAPVPAPESGVCDVDSAGIAAVIDLLCTDGLVDRAFRVDCGQCGVDAYPGLDSLGAGAPRCPACGGAAAYARAESGEPAFHYRVHPLLRRLSYGPLPTVLAASAALLAEGAHLAAYPQVRTRRDWERLDALGWHGDSVFGLVAVHPAAAPPEMAVARCAAAGVDVVVVAAIGTLPEDQLAAYAESTDRAGLLLSVLDADDLILPALALPRKRNGRRSLPQSPAHTLVIELDGLAPTTVETAPVGDRGRLSG